MNKKERRLKDAQYSTTCYEYIEARGGYLLQPRNGINMLLETQQTFVSKRFLENKTNCGVSPQVKLVNPKTV